jgi:Tfp pilus assembly PilM family ATPase
MRGLTLLGTERPSVAVEITSRRVAAIALAERAGGVLIAAHAEEALPPGAVAPALNSSNITDASVVIRRLRRVFSQLGRTPRRVALVLPDSLAKVSLIRLEKVPARAHDLEQLIHFHLRKAAPFRIEDAQITYAPASAVDGGGREFVVVLARRDVVQEFERACEEAGAHAGLVDLATFDLLNVVLAAESPSSGDWLLVHVDADYSSLAILRGADLIFFRNRPGEGHADLVDLVHQTAMYYEDRLAGRGFARVFLSGPPADGAGGLEQARRQVEERLGVRMEAVDPRRVAPFADRISAGPEVLDKVAPLVGVLVRDRVSTTRHAR